MDNLQINGSSKKLITTHMLQSKENLSVETVKHIKVHDY